MDQLEVKKLLSKLQVGWPKDIEATDSMANFWHWGLSDVPYEIAEAAAQRYVLSGTPYAPKVSDIRAIIAEAAVGDITPEAVWAEIKTEIRRHPFGVKKIFDHVTQTSIENPGPQFSHPLIAEAVASVGWQTICQAEDETKSKDQFTWTLKALKERALKQTKQSSMDGEGINALGQRVTVLALNGSR